VRHFETRSGSSLGGGDDLGAYFGLGTSGSVSNLTITWPSGTVQTLTNVAVNQRLTVTEEGGGNIPPTASFTTTVNDLSVDVNASASSDSDGSIVSYAWTFGDGGTGTGQTASHNYIAYGTYTITLTVTDNEGATGSTTRSVTLTDGTGGTGAFLEAGGMVVMEAENFAANIPRGVHSWVVNTANAGFSGLSAMNTTPDNGAQITVDVPNTSPELAFDVNFTTTGDFYMWGRVWAPGSNGDRMHFGFDGAIPSNSNGIISKTVYNSWQWVDMIGSGTRQTIDVVTGGLHEVNVWMREDGMLIDKIVLTTDAAFTPTGTGPAESPRDGGGGTNPPPVASFTASTTNLTVNVDASASSDDGSIVSYAWTFGDGGTATGVTASRTYAAAGTYTIVLTVTDDEGATGTASQNVTVTTGGGGSGSFIESAGMVVMEAENFHANISRSSHDWVLSTANAGFSGGGSMASTPDDGTMIKNAAETTSPELSFDVTFGTTGVYYLWGRIWAPDSKDKTVHIGINGDIPSNVNGLTTTTYGAWVWVDLIKTGLRQTLSVGTAGEHTIHIWMREDGLVFDKIVMTTDVNFTPSGTGPAESPRAAAPSTAKKVGVDSPALQLMAAQDLPTEFALEGNYPNPFNPTTAIRFALPEAASVRLEVYDAMGRRVATLLDNTLEAGRHEAIWEGRTDGGITVASGVYLYRIEAGSFTAVKSMLLVK
jgi:PKD repeat protein